MPSYLENGKVVYYPMPTPVYAPSPTYPTSPSVTNNSPTTSGDYAQNINRQTADVTNKSIPAWLLPYIQSQAGAASSLTNAPTTPYTGQFTAPLTAEENRGIALAGQLPGQAQIGLNKAADLYGTVGQYGVGGPSTAQLDAYTNPYNTRVMDVSRQRQEEAYIKDRNQLLGRLGQTASFGGSGSAIAEAEMSRNFENQLAEQEAKQLYQNYNQAQEGVRAGMNLASTAAAGTGTTAMQGQAAGLADIGAQYAAGGLKRGIAQDDLSARYQEFIRGQDQKTQNFTAGSNALSNILGSTIGSNTTGSLTQRDFDSGNPASPAPNQPLTQPTAPQQGPGLPPSPGNPQGTPGTYTGGGGAPQQGPTTSGAPIGTQYSTNNGQPWFPGMPTTGTNTGQTGSTTNWGDLLGDIGTSIGSNPDIFGGDASTSTGTTRPANIPSNAQLQEDGTYFDTNTGKTYNQQGQELDNQGNPITATPTGNTSGEQAAAEAIDSATRDMFGVPPGAIYVGPAEAPYNINTPDGYASIQVGGQNYYLSPSDFNLMYGMRNGGIVPGYANGGQVGFTNFDERYQSPSGAPYSHSNQSITSMARGGLVAAADAYHKKLVKQYNEGGLIPGYAQGGMVQRPPMPMQARGLPQRPVQPMGRMMPMAQRPMPPVMTVQDRYRQMQPMGGTIRGYAEGGIASGPFYDPNYAATSAEYESLAPQQKSLINWEASQSPESGPASWAPALESFALAYPGKTAMEIALLFTGSALYKNAAKAGAEFTKLPVSKLAETIKGAFKPATKPLQTLGPNSGVMTGTGAPAGIGRRVLTHPGTYVAGAAGLGALSGGSKDINAPIAALTPAETGREAVEALNVFGQLLQGLDKPKVAAVAEEPDLIDQLIKRVQGKDASGKPPWDERLAQMAYEAGGEPTNSPVLATRRAKRAYLENISTQMGIKNPEDKTIDQLTELAKIKAAKKGELEAARIEKMKSDMELNKSKFELKKLAAEEATSPDQKETLKVLELLASGVIQPNAQNVAQMKALIRGGGQDSLAAMKAALAKKEAK